MPASNLGFANDCTAAFSRTRFKGPVTLQQQSFFRQAETKGSEWSECMLGMLFTVMFALLIPNQLTQLA